MIATQKLPNILWITTDQQRFDSLGCNGSLVAQTPNLDRLAADGLNFQRHFTANPVCSPSRASLLTGLLPSEHGLWCNGCALPENVPTIPGALSAMGYETAHFGKFHLVPIMNRVNAHPAYGYEICSVSEGDQDFTGDDYFTFLRCNHPGAFIAWNREVHGNTHEDGYASALPDALHHSTFVTGQALDYLRKDRTRGKPFFLAVEYFDPHHAFNPPEVYFNRFLNKAMPNAAFHPDSLATRSEYYSTMPAALNAKRLADTQRAYHGMIAQIDDNVGRLLAELEQQELLENTIVIFTSDHGEMLGNHGMLRKGPFLLDDLLHVPLIISGAGTSPAQVTELSSAIDLFASVLSLARGKVQTYGSGIPLCSNSGELFPLGKREYVLAEWEGPETSGNRSQRMIRTKDEKLIYYNFDTRRSEYYNLVSDPEEFFNRYAEAEQNGAVQTLHRLLTEIYQGDLNMRTEVPCATLW